MIEVVIGPTGQVRIECDPDTAAALAGRRSPGVSFEVQRVLAQVLAEAWYAAGCPPVMGEAA